MVSQQEPFVLFDKIYMCYYKQEIIYHSGEYRTHFWCLLAKLSHRALDSYQSEEKAGN